MVEGTGTFDLPTANDSDILDEFLTLPEQLERADRPDLDPQPALEEAAGRTAVQDLNTELPRQDAKGVIAPGQRWRLLIAHRLS
jgi:hypothetical protein